MFVNTVYFTYRSSNPFLQNDSLFTIWDFSIEDNPLVLKGVSKPPSVTRRSQPPVVRIFGCTFKGVSLIWVVSTVVIIRFPLTGATVTSEPTMFYLPSFNQKGLLSSDKSSLHMLNLEEHSEGCPICKDCPRRNLETRPLDLKDFPI